MGTETKTVEQLFAEIQTMWHEMKEQMATAQGEIKKFGGETAESKSIIEKLNARIDENEVKMQHLVRRAELAAGRQDPAERTPEHKAFMSYLRRGFAGVDEEERKHLVRAGKSDIEGKALTLGDSTIASYLAPPEFVAEILKPLLQFSPIRQYARVRQTSNRSVQVPVRKGTFAATWVSETGTRSETTGLKYGLEELPTHEMYAEVLLSQQEIEDAAFDLDAEMSDESGEQFGIAEGKAFLGGSGVGQPMGILSDANLVTSNVGSTTALSYSGIVTFVHKLKSPYVPNAVIMMHRLTMGLVRQIVDGQQRPIWDPSLAPGNPATILGIPMAEAVDMPQVSSGNLVMLLGDIKRAYTVVDRVQIVVQRLIEKYAEQGQIAYLVRKRVGGQLVLADSLIALKMST